MILGFSPLHLSSPSYSSTEDPALAKEMEWLEKVSISTEEISLPARQTSPSTQIKAIGLRPSPSPITTLERSIRLENGQSMSFFNQ